MDEQLQKEAKEVAASWIGDPDASLVQFLDDLCDESPNIAGIGMKTMLYAQFDRAVADAAAAAIKRAARSFPLAIDPPPSYNAQTTAMSFGMLHLAPWSIAAIIIGDSPNPVVDAVRASLYVADRAQRGDALRRSLPTFVSSGVQGQGKILSGTVEIAWSANEDGSFGAIIDLPPSEKPHVRELHQSWQDVIAAMEQEMQPNAWSEQENGSIVRLYIHGEWDDVGRTIAAIHAMRIEMIASFAQLKEFREIAALLN